MTVPRPDQPPNPSGKTVAVLITLTVLLMTFSIVSGLLGNPALSASAGVIACGLIADICRRLLGSDNIAPPAPPSLSTPALLTPQPPDPTSPESAAAATPSEPRLLSEDGGPR